jgi:ubiquinone/menaquinone biosynthesis C-methylase UbiE
MALEGLGAIGAAMNTERDSDGGTIQAAQLYWDSAADKYEEVFSGTLIGKTRREAVWRELERLFGPGKRVLEINCGTGLDAVFLAEQGVELLACDISPRMIDRARQHAARHKVSDYVEFLALATENLGTLSDQSLFDGAFSNFSGLNCVEDLTAVQVQLAKRLKPGAPLLLCMMGRFALWEMLWFLLHRKPKLAFRRLREKTDSVTKSPEVKIHRPAVEEIRSQFAPLFRLRRWRGVGIAVPPSYMEHWARRFPRLIGFLAALDQRIGGLPIFRSAADCVVLEFERVGEI